MPRCEKCKVMMPPDMVNDSIICVFCETSKNYIIMEGQEIPKDFIVGEYARFLASIAESGNVKKIIDAEKEKANGATIIDINKTSG